MTWDAPNNIDRPDIVHYIIYVPSQGRMFPDLSNTNYEFTLSTCRDGDVSILVAAVNRFGCEGPNSSEIQPSPLTPQVTMSVGK